MSQASSQLSDLLWQFKLQIERQLSIKESLRDLLADPERLAALLDQAEQAGDDNLRDLVAQIRAAQKSGGAVPKSRGASTAVLAVVGLVLVLLAAMAVWFRSHQAVPAIKPVAAAPAPPPPQILFRMHGSNTIGEKLAPTLAEAYLKTKGAVSTEVQTLGSDVEHKVIGHLADGRRLGIEVFAHGSGTSAKDLAAGTTDIGMSSRRINSDELAQLQPKFGDLSAPNAEHVLGLDGVAVIVNPNNPVSALSMEQVGQIFSGQIADWSQAGGGAAAIALYARNNESGTFDTFDNLVLKAKGLKLADAAHRIESSTELTDAVTANPAGIGFIGLPYVLRAKALGIISTSGARAIVPTALTVGTEDYPLSRRLYFYLPANSPNRDAADFVEFALSSAGQEIVKTVGFISLNIRTEPVAEDPTLPADYRKVIAGAQRLSLNFRFETGKDVLDTKAQRDMRRLVDYLQANPDRSLILIGFTDNHGSASANLTLSAARASTVAAALKERGIDVRDVRGFGAEMPIASNDTDAGREKNRRVEAWLR